MRERVRPALAAVSFLTALPVGRGIGERDLRRGVVLLPLVGAAVGALVALVAWGAALALPASAAAVLGVAGGVAATGALHLDGLGDVADGVGASLAGRNPVSAMRDPRLGGFGVAAVVLDLSLRAALLAALLADGFPWPMLAAGALARTVPIALAWRLPYVGAGSGGWTSGANGRHTALTALIALGVAVPSAGIASVGMAIAVAVAATPVGRWSRRRLGGATGDVFGAAVELAETAALLGAVALGARPAG